MRRFNQAAGPTRKLLGQLVHRPVVEYARRTYAD